jgi:hypothetical protein
LSARAIQEGIFTAHSNGPGFLPALSKLCPPRSWSWLSGFVEWDYYQFRNSVANLNCTLALPCGGLTPLPVNVDTNVKVVKAGLNLRFGPGVRY